jgi:hypothetical protein
MSDDYVALEAGQGIEISDSHITLDAEYAGKFMAQAYCDHIKETLGIGDENTLGVDGIYLDKNLQPALEEEAIEAFQRALARLHPEDT